MYPKQHSSDEQERQLAEFMNNIRKQKSANNLSSSRIQEIENLPSWQWQANLCTKQFSDTCPKCKQIIEFDQANAKDLDNEHDNGKGGTCRFRGAVVEGKIQQNIDKRTKRFSDTCPKCKQIIDFDQANAKDLDNEHDNGEGGTCRFRGAVVEGKIQQSIDKVFTKKCFKCQK